MLELITEFASYVWLPIDFILHVDVHLNSLVISLGPWLYLALFLIIFAETGLVFTPILPGDSLLFAAGAITAIDGSPLNIYLLVLLLIVAGILGDGFNYSCGRYFGLRWFNKENSIFFNRKYLDYTSEFYNRHGGKTIIIARYVPIVRTFAPFVAGMGKMQYRRFFAYNCTGAVSWVCIFTFGGYALGNIPAVKKNFHIAIFAIIFVSVLPAVIEIIRIKMRPTR